MRVTTIIPAFNAVSHIRRAVDSALRQGIPSSEIIVVDDASHDGTADLVSSYGDRVRLIRHDRTLGASSARNTGIKNARGAFLAFLDADDEWLPGKLTKQLAIMEMTPTMSIIGCRAEIFDSSGRNTGDAFRGAIPITGAAAWKTLLAHTFLATPCVVARRTAVEAAGHFDASLRVGEDQDMWIRLGLVGEVGYVHDTLVRVHSRTRSLSTMPAKERAAFVMPMIKKHVERLRPRLSNAEIRYVLGERMAKFGRQAYAEGDFKFGFRFLVGAIALGHDPFQNILHIGGAFATKQRIKRYFRRNPDDITRVPVL